MRRFALPGVIAAVAAALLAVLAFGVAHSGVGSAVGAQVQSGRFPRAPKSHLELPMLGSGRPADLAQLRGHVVMIEFFAGWCDACQTDAGIVRGAERTLAKHGGTVLGVTFQDSSTDASNYLREYHLHVPVLHDTNGELAAAYGVNGVPETFILNPAGQVVAYRPNQLTRQWMHQTLAKVLGAQA